MTTKTSEQTLDPNLEKDIRAAVRLMKELGLRRMKVQYDATQGFDLELGLS